MSDINPIHISIHALLAESDTRGEHHANTQQEFLSTLSLRRATSHNLNLPSSPIISIHALLAESDILGRKSIRTPKYFYPRSPCGERPQTKQTQNHQGDFYPRSPCGERPHKPNKHKTTKEISIHALLAESDRAASITPTPSRNFYPRSPCGERRQKARPNCQS